MSSLIFHRPWIGTLCFALLCLLFVLWHLIPGSAMINTLPAPDLMFALTLTFAMRRPDLTPYWLIGAVFLIADILLQRPIGLWAAIVLIAAEFARSHAWRYRDVHFVADWLFVSVVILASALSYRIVLGFVLVEQGGLSGHVLWGLMTALIYPVVVFMCLVLFGIGKQETIEPRGSGRLG